MAENTTAPATSPAAEFASAIGEALDRVAGRIEQSNQAAIKAVIESTRERANDPAVSPEAREDAKRELVEKGRRFDAENPPEPRRVTEYSLTEARELANDYAGVRAETKAAYAGLIGQRIAKAGVWADDFSRGRTPLDVVMCGTWLPHTEKTAQGIVLNTTRPLVIDDEAVKNAQDLSDAMLFWRLLYQAKHGSLADYRQCPWFPQFRAAMERVGKALDTTDTSNWVPTGFSAQFLARYDLARNLERFIPAFKMPRNPFDYYVMGAMLSTYKVAENTADPESATAVTTSDLEDLKVSLSLVSLATRMGWSYEVDEDSIIALATAWRNEVAISLSYAVEDAIINGDTTATHRDSDVTTATDHRKAWDGLRDMALANTYSTDIGAFNAEAVAGLAKSMGKYGAIKSDLAFVTGTSGWWQIHYLKDSQNNAVMLNTPTSNPSPTVQGINVPQVFGIPLIVSQAFRENMNATGVYDGTTTTKTGILCVNRTGYILGYTSEAPLVDTQKEIRMRQFEVVASLRREFEDTYAIASNKTVWYGYNLTA